MLTTSRLLTLEQRAALGDVVAESAYLESNLDMFIGVLTKLNESQFEALLSGQMLGRKLQIVKEIGVPKIRSQKGKAEFAEIVDALSSAITDRNAVVHGIWGGPGGMWKLSWIFGPVTGPVLATHRKKGGKVRTVPAERIADIAEKIRAGHTKLFNYFVEVFIRKKGRRLVGGKPL
jgi:hypothetical protein